MLAIMNSSRVPRARASVRSRLSAEARYRVAPQRRQIACLASGLAGEKPSLPGLALFQARFEERREFMQAHSPVRGNQHVRRNLAAQAPDFDQRRQVFEHVDHRVEVALRVEQRETLGSGAVLVGEPGVADDLQLVELERVERQSGQRPGASDQAVAGFERQAVQQVAGDDLAASGGAPDGVLRAG